MSAASGAGKTTLKDKVIGEFPDIVYSISATTRSPREGEVNGVHYFFKTKEEFEKGMKDLISFNSNVNENIDQLFAIRKETILTIFDLAIKYNKSLLMIKFIIDLSNIKIDKVKNRYKKDATN